jgi:PKD repeat protein
VPTAVNYWLFYIFDPKQEDGLSQIFAHQSDLETITILIQDGAPRWAAASQHYGGERIEWRKLSENDNHVDVYPALGAHSMYLHNTDNFDGGGFFGQEQHVPSYPRSSDILTEHLYSDTTGNASVWSNLRNGDVQYQLVPLTGDEMWAAYDGVFGPREIIGGAKVPMERQRWNDIVAWIEQMPLSDEVQIRAELSSETISVNNVELEAQLSLENIGPKPNQWWLKVQAKPTQDSWSNSTVETIQTSSVKVGTNDEESISFSESVPQQAGEWRLRIQLFKYPPEISEKEDLNTHQTIVRNYTIQDTTTPTPETATPATPTPATPTPTTPTPKATPENPPVDLPAIIGDKQPQDTDNDGKAEDIDGNGHTDIFDVQALFQNLNAEAIQNNSETFNFDAQGGVDIFDVQALFRSVI